MLAVVVAVVGGAHPYVPSIHSFYARGLVGLFMYFASPAATMYIHGHVYVAYEPGTYPARVGFVFPKYAIQSMFFSFHVDAPASEAFETRGTQTPNPPGSFVKFSSNACFVCPRSVE